MSTKFEKKNLSVKSSNKAVQNREFGEVLESKLTPEELAEGKKPSLYIKVTAKPEELQKLQPGFTLSFEDPKAKFQRQITKLADDPKAVEQITERMNKIPSFVKRRLVMRIPID
jgi:hypothetical protein